MLGQPISMLIPEVVGVRLTGKLNEGITATDLVLVVTHLLREQGVVGKFVEFLVSDYSNYPLLIVPPLAICRGIWCHLRFFPIDDETLTYLRLSGRDEHTIKLVEAYSKAQGLWHDPRTLILCLLM